jgi:hypothetical protein
MSNIFQIGPHVLNVFESGDGWRVSVNGYLAEDSFVSRNDAWAAGLAELDHTERFAAAAGDTAGQGRKLARAGSLGLK